MFAMYTAEQLKDFPYFDEYLKDFDMAGVLDSLTGLISRPFMLKFIHHLINHKIPFTLAELDLDNFKFINDTYGHKIGDGVLEGVAEDLIRYLADYGIAGRIGGDEFLIVNLRDLTYDEVKKFYLEMYANFNVLRKNIELDSCSPFITGTLGSATFPTDASDYDALFALVDKTLYRGKTKGRNCYIIYVEAKHKDIVIKDLKGHGLFNTFHDLAEKFDSVYDAHEKMKAMYSVLEDAMRITDLYYIGINHELRSINKKGVLAVVRDVDSLLTNGICNSNQIEKMKDRSPSFYEFLKAHELETVLLVPVGTCHETIGYLLCAEPRSLRIWQEDECAILFSVGRMLAGFLRATDSTL